MGFPFNWSADGAFDYRIQLNATQAVNHTSPDYIAKHDGTATTISHGENIDATVYVPASNTAEPNQCILWDPSAPLGWNKDAGNGNGTIDWRHARPSSNHPGGAVIAYCDGHTQWVNDTINYQVYAMLMTSAGSLCQAPGVAANPPFPNAYYNYQMQIVLDTNSVPSN